MKVLYFIDSLVASGAEQSLLALAPHYVDAGISLEVAYLHDRPGLQEDFRDLGVSLHCLDDSRGRVGWLRAARSLIDQRRPDLVHTTLFEADVAGRSAAFLAGVPAVSSLVNAMYGPEQFGDPKVSAIKLRLAQATDLATARMVRRFHSISEHVAEVMSRRLRIDRDKIDVIPRGRHPLALGDRTPERRARVRSRLGIGDADVLVLAAARHEYQKGLKVAIEALPHVMERVPNVRMLIAGRSGNATPDLHTAVRRLGLDARIRFLGARDDVPDLMAAADVFVIPSLWEGLGGTAIEALGLQVPIVASDLPPIREVVGDDRVARLLPAGEFEPLADAIVSVLLDPAAAARSARLGHRRFVERFTMESVAGQMMAFYERVMAAEGSRVGRAATSRPAPRRPAVRRRPSTPRSTAELHVLCLIDSLVPGGAERSLAALLPHYVDRGVDVTVGYLGDRPGLQEEVAAAGARLVNLDGWGRRGGNAYRATKLVRDARPDVIHTTLFESDLAGRMASLLTGIPVVSTLPAAMYDWEHVHDPSLTSWRVHAARLADMTTAQRVRRFHAVSAHVADVMAPRLRVDRDRIDVIPRGRDPHTLGRRSQRRRRLTRERLGIPPGDLVIFAAARQEHKKGLDVLLEAFARVRADIPRARLIVAGREGMQTPLLLDIKARLSLNGSVAFLGPRSDVPDLLCAADVFVLPSVSEGFPGAVLEAMALEAPIVASDLPSTREILDTGSLARFVVPRDADAMATAIVETLSDPDTAAEMTAAARERFVDRYSVASVAACMVDFYRRALRA